MSDSMADAAQQLLAFLRNVGYPYVTSITGVFQAMRTIRTFMESLDPETLDEIQKKALLVIETLVNTVFKVYIFTTNRIASISATFGDILGLKGEIPDDMRPKVDEIRGYLEKAKAEIVEIDTVAQDMAAKIEQACENDFQISQLEMKKLQRGEIQLTYKLKTCEEYLNAVDEVLGILEADVRAKLIELGFAAAVTAYFSGTLLMAEAGASVVGVPAVLGVGVAFLYFKLLKIMYNYSHVLRVECEKLKSEFRSVKVEFRRRTRNMEEQNEERDLLEMTG